MVFWEVMQWWEEWQLRILVLTSLFLQCFLSFAGILRKSCIPSWLRFLIWLAYLSSDHIAIYALATLFNRQRTQDWVSMSTHERSAARLQALWAPVLLIHLGGQDGITAYNIEDNELWRRHVLTAVSQVAIAAYVFRNSWLEYWEAGVLLFAVGILKCVLKPWELKRVSINSLVDSSAAEENSDISSLDEYIRASTENFREGRQGQQMGTNQGDGFEHKMWKPYDLFVDIAPPYSDRLNCLKAMVHNNTDKAHDLVPHGLSRTFNRLYTKESLLFYNMLLIPDTSYTTKLLGFICSIRASVTMLAACLILNIPLRISRSLLEAQADEYDHSHTDVEITIILISHAVVLDFILPIPIYSVQIFQQFREGRWPDEVAQYNIMGYLARNKKHRKLRRLATLLVCKDYIDQLWCMQSCKSSSDITKLVHSYIAQAWTEHHIKDMATYRAFNDNRGQWTLNWEGCGDSLTWSLDRQFDESVLLWHLATDFCFHRTGTPSTDETAQRCRVMSNYMLYLLFVNPEMLMTGARRSLFREAYRQLKEMLKLIPQLDTDDAGPSRHDECELVRKVAHNIQQASGHQFRFINDALRLAQHLQSLCVEQEQDNAKMWKVVQGVWVEMLCFSAGRCRGYLHAKNLGKGGEYLSYIWLLMSYMGMETLAERMQRPKLKEEDARSNGGSSNGTTTTTASSSSIATGGSANRTTAAIPGPAAGGGHRDGTTEASTSTPVTEGGDADGTIPASPVTTADPGDNGRIGASLVTPSGDENV